MVVIAFLLYRGPAVGVPSAVVTLDVEGAFVQGSETASIGIVMYSDYRCPYCRRFAAETLPALRERFVEPGAVRLVFRNLPLERLHPDARSLAAAAVCAGWQGRFWQMHDQLFASPPPVGRSLSQVFRDTALDEARGIACLQQPAAAAIVAADRNEARLLGIDGTPTFLIGRFDPGGLLRVHERVAGLASIDRFERAVGALQDRP